MAGRAAGLPDAQDQRAEAQRPGMPGPLQMPGFGGGWVRVGRRMMWDSDNGSRQAQWMGPLDSRAKKPSEQGPLAGCEPVTLVSWLDNEL